MIKCIAFLSVRNGKKSLKVLCTMWIVPCKTTMYEKVKNFGTIGRVEQKKYANTVFLKRSRYVLCYNVNNLQKNFVPVCCSLWLPKRTADTTIKPVHPYRNNLFLYREVRNWFCRRLQEAETHIFLIKNWCFYGCGGQKCECKQPEQQILFFFSEFTLAIHQVFLMTVQSKSGVLCCVQSHTVHVYGRNSKFLCSFNLNTILQRIKKK